MFRNFFLHSCHLWGNVEKYGAARHPTDDSVIRRMRFTCLNNEGHKRTLYTYVVLIAFPQQQWLHERASLLRYTYIMCRALFFFFTFVTAVKQAVRITVCSLFVRVWRTKLKVLLSIRSFLKKELSCVCDVRTFVFRIYLTDFYKTWYDYRDSGVHSAGYFIILYIQ